MNALLFTQDYTHPAPARNPVRTLNPECPTDGKAGPRMGDPRNIAEGLSPPAAGAGDGCGGHHCLIGHGMAPLGIDRQGGGSDAWVMLEPDDFEFWDG